MFILASQSPIRAQILTEHGISFTARPSEYEEIFLDNETLEENAQRLALGKAEWIFERLSEEEQKNTVVIGVDTIMKNPSGKLLEKPKDKEEALQMMADRSGKCEELYSGIALVWSGGKKVGGETSFIFWENIPEEAQKELIETGEWEGKCGGLAIEGPAREYVQKINGSIENIMGFPLKTFWEMMENGDILESF